MAPFRSPTRQGFDTLIIKKIWTLKNVQNSNILYGQFRQPQAAHLALPQEEALHHGAVFIHHRNGEALAVLGHPRREGPHVLDNDVLLHVA